MSDWFDKDEPLTSNERLALAFLLNGGPHQVGVIDDEEKLAAAFVFTSLIHKGCVLGAANASGGPTYHLTSKGRTAARSGAA